MLSDGKVLFIVHDVYQDDNTFPLGIGYMAAMLEKYGAQVDVISQDVFHSSNEAIGKYLDDHPPYDMICLGFLAARFRETVLPLCQMVNKHKKNAWLVLGGHGAAPIPEYMIETTGADIVCIGESERIIVDLLKCALECGDLRRVEGIVYRAHENKIITTNARKPTQRLDTIPLPAYHLFPMDKYTSSMEYFNMDKDEKSMGIITSRGCINRCSFCYRLERGLRFRRVSDVVDEMSMLHDEYGVTYFNLLDECFAYPRKRVFEFKDELAAADLKIKFHTNIRVDAVDDEVLTTLKGAGCQFLNVGFESTSQAVLDAMHKNTTVEDNFRVAELIKRSGIGLGVNLIWGCPGDTEETLYRNADMIKKYNTLHQLRTIRPVTPYPGCELYYTAIDQGLLSGPDDFFNKFKNSDLITANFTDIPDTDCYNLLFEVNSDLIIDYFKRTTGDLDAARSLISDFYDLYFEKSESFRGARHYQKD